MTGKDWAEIRRLRRPEGMAIKAISRKLGISRNAVRRALAVGTRRPPPQSRASRSALVYDAPDRGRPSGALLWIHGGGLILGRPELDHAWCSRISHELGIVVVSVRYRLAPEDPFPAGLDDCAATLDWLHDHAEDLGVDPTRIAVGGASAGGGLAAALCQRAHDEGRSFGAAGVRRAGPADGPRRAPSRLDRGGELDLFLDEDVDNAVRLRAAGVPCQLDRVPGMYHGADVHLAETSALMRAFRQRMLDALEAAIGADLNRGSGRVSRFGGHGHADRAHWVAQTAPPSSRGEP